MDLLESIRPGFAAAETMWSIRRGRAVPVALRYRPPSWFKPDPEDPLLWRLRSADNLDGVPLQADKWVVHMARAKSGFPVQAGLGRALLWWYMFKRYAVADWNKYGELFGAPFRLGRFDPHTASDDEIDDLEEALATIGVDSWAAIPKTVEIEFVGDSSFRSGPDIYQKMVDYCDECLAVGILGQSLTSGSQTGSVGSYALGQVHNSVRLEIRQADARELAASIGQGLIEPMVRFNYGPLARVPRLRFKVEPPTDKKAEAVAQSTRADVYKKAGAMGVPVSRAQLYEDLGLRAPEGEDVLYLRSVPGAEEPAEEPAEE
jgi:phage gp29-like protein